jgi:hypothetical protein
MKDRNTGDPSGKGRIPKAVPFAIYDWKNSFRVFRGFVADLHFLRLPL